MQVKKAEKMNRVLDAASELFSDKGFHEVKLDEVARRADVGKGTIYTYFSSKDELFVQCILHDAPVYEERIESVINSYESFEAALQKLISIQFDFVQDKGPLVKQMMTLGPQLKVSDREYKLLTGLFEKAIRRLGGFFQQGIDSGLLRQSLTAGQMAIMFQSIFDLNVMFTFFKEPIMRQSDVFDSLMRIFGSERSNR